MTIASEEPNGCRKTSIFSRKQISSIFECQSTKNVIYMLVLAIAILPPAFASNYVLEILTFAFMYVVLCLGLNIVVGFAGLLDLGFSAFFAVGAYTTAILSTQFGFNFWLTIPCAVMFATIAGIVIGGPTLRLRSDYLAVVTLGFGEIIQIAARNLSITGGPSGIHGIERPSLVGIELNSIDRFYYVFLALAVLACLASARLAKSRIGRAWNYVRCDEDAASAMGINRAAVKLYAYICGAIFAAIAGSFFAVKLTAVAPTSFGFYQSVLILIGVVLGGIGNINGVVIGALVICLLPEVLRDTGSFRMLGLAVLLLVIMLVRPTGIWGKR